MVVRALTTPSRVFLGIPLVADATCGSSARARRSPPGGTALEGLHADYRLTVSAGAEDEEGRPYYELERELTVRGGIYPAAAEMAEFARAVMRADAQVAVVGEVRP